MVEALPAVSVLTGMVTALFVALTMVVTGQAPALAVSKAKSLCSLGGQ